jgi:hypothetical protein
MMDYLTEVQSDVLQTATRRDWHLHRYAAQKAVWQGQGHCAISGQRSPASLSPNSLSESCII